MTTPLSESVLRNYIADHLPLLDSNLHLIQTEYHLPNQFGSDGFIDILARDQYNLRVVIELKRSNQTARQALHELYKYTALLKLDHGFIEDNVRCVLLSTDWRELRVPFSEFARATSYDVEGFEIQLDAFGNPTHFKAIELAPEGEGLAFCPQHMIYLFRDKERRYKSLQNLEQVVDHIGIKDYVVVLLDGTRVGGIVFPFGLYLVLTAIPLAKRWELGCQLSMGADEDDSETDGARYDDWSVESAVLIKVGNAFSDPDDREIGYPDKFGQLRREWNIAEVKRYGTRIGSNTMRTDEEVLDLINGLQGENTVLYYCASTPKRVSHWRTAIRKAEYCLLGNTVWKEGFREYCREIESDGAQCSMTAHVYNPLNLLVTLHKLHDMRYMPMLEVIVEKPDKKQVTRLFGYIEWNDRRYPSSVEDVLKRVGLDPLSYMISYQFSELWEYDEALLEQHGLRYALFEMVLEQDQAARTHAIVYRNGILERAEITKQPGESFSEFAQRNVIYLHSLHNFFLQNVVGL